MQTRAPCHGRQAAAAAADDDGDDFAGGPGAGRVEADASEEEDPTGLNPGRGCRMAALVTRRVRKGLSRADLF